MGALRRYACGCGYVSDELVVGPLASDVVYVLVTCAKCRSLRSLPHDDVRAGCGRHRLAFATWRGDGADVPCPRCGTALASTMLAICD